MWGYKIQPNFATCSKCDVAWANKPGVKPRCWRCGRFGKPSYLYLYGPQSVKFEKGIGPTDPPYLTGGMYAASGSDRPSTQRVEEADLREAAALD